MKDAFGYDVTVESVEALAAMNRARHGVLSHGAGTLDDLNAALALDGGFVMAHALKGLLMMTLARRELVATARSCLDAARTSMAMRGATDREQCYVGALEAWLAGHPARAASILDDRLQSHPRDTLLMKLVQAIRFMCGDQRGMRASVEGVLKGIGPDHPELGYVLGCHAFTLEETGDYRRAEAVGRRGVDLAPDDAWGIHAVAHVFDMNRRPQEGISWIAGLQKNWAHCNNFRYHLYWHLALFHLEQRDYDKVLNLYDRHVNAEGSDDYRDISNSASLLARLDLEGIDCQERWQALADLAAHRLNDGILGFADLHYLISLAGAGRLDDVDRLGNRIADTGRTHPDTAQRTAALIAGGLKAFAHADYPRAFEGLAKAVPALVSVGGSHAQRDVFVRLAVEAGIRAGAFEQAAGILELRGKKRQQSDVFADDRRATIRSCLNNGEKTPMDGDVPVAMTAD